MRGLAGKVAVVAGGGGIGGASAIRLAQEGAKVVIGDLLLEEAERVAGLITAEGGEAIAVQFDITEEDSVSALIETAITGFGALDVMHVNAADLGVVAQDTDALTVTTAVFDRTMEANLRGHLLCTRYALPHLLKSSAPAIVYTSSLAAHGGEPERVAYAASKAGINALMRHVVSRWGKEGVRANTIAPGLIVTPNMLKMLGPDSPFFSGALASSVRGNRLGAVEDIAAAAAFLLSEDAGYLTGQVISVDGGSTMRP